VVPWLRLPMRWPIMFSRAPSEPRTDVTALASAHQLSASLGAIVLEARALAGAILPGLHGLRRAGRGERYWQHREMRDGETLRGVDWRRSARSDRLYARELEQENPARLQIWCDLRPSMDWTGAPARHTKAQAGLVLGLGLGLAVLEAGEAVMVLGSGPVRRDSDMALGLLRAGQAGPIAGATGARSGNVLLVSDGLEPPDVWHRRVLGLRNGRGEVFVALFADPAEINFPYSGRLQVTAPKQAWQVGRAEVAASNWAKVYGDHMASVRVAIEDAGGHVFSHRADQPVTPIALQIANRLSGARTFAQQVRQVAPT
jgi:uncharacterized protein (DUF58 family)